MKKVTKRLLVACVAALSVGACQDSVQVVTPEPPPPAPPPPAVDATVTIQGLRTIPGNQPVNPTNVMGDINVVLNIEEGDNEVTQIDLLLDGNPVGCTAISTNQVPGEGVRLSQAASDVVECFFNTDDTAGECVGEQLDAAFSDGEHTLSARVTLGDGTTRTADNAQQITLNNGDFIALAHIPGITVISGGVNYYGGPLDTDGDGEDDNLNQIAACPVAFGGEVIDQLSLIASTGGPQAVDLGNGPGAAVTLNPPFIVDIDPADNVGVEDDVATFGLMSGHTFQLTGTILDEDGLDVTAQFNASPLGPIFLDYTAPVVDPLTAEISVDGNAVLGGEYFSAGDFDILAGVTDMGVGFTTGTGATFDVGACDVADNVDEDASTDFTALFADVVAIDDITEDDPVLDADTNGEDCYVGEVTSLTDDLFNATDLTAQETINTGGAGAATPTFHGKDATAPVIDEFQPDPPDGTVILNDVAIMFDAADPDLESGDPGSGVDNTACTAAADGTTCTNITAVDEDDETYEVFMPAAGSFSVDIADVGGAGSAGALADGPHTITVTVPDLATAPNEATADIAFDLDTSAPSFGALNPVPGGSAGTAATSIIQSIGGTITDAHDIVMASISVFADGTDALGAGGDGVCTTGDYLLDDGAGEIDRNQVDISGTTDVSFNESFEIFEPTSASVTVTYCFIIEAEDGAVDKTGAANPNQASLSTQANVNWLP